MSTSVIAMRGYKGPTVERIQRQLNSLSSAGLEPDGDFGSNTEAAVKNFQRDNGLMSDGIVGMFTDAALSLVPLTRVLPRVPPHVSQGNALKCWAAATESWLRAQPHRRNFTMDQIVEGMIADGFARTDGALPVSTQWAWEDRFGLRPLVEKASEFFAERSLARLQLEKKPLLLGLKGAIGHVVVLFGVQVSGLSPQVLIVDPISADHTSAMNVKDIQARKGNVVTWMHKMPLIF